MKKQRFLIIGLLVFAISLISFSFYAYQAVKTPNILVEQKNKVLLIPSGTTFDQLQSKLHQEDYVHDMLSFSVLSKLMKYDQNVKPGRYELHADMSNLEAIQLLRSGEQAPVNVTFNNVRLKPELAERLCENIQADAATFAALLNDSAVVARYGFNTENVLSMFVPNTYQFFWTTDEEALLERMHREYEKFWTAERRQKADSLNMTPTEVTILASIVESETNKPDEAPTVAGLYLNRLDRNIALEADPTLVFAAQDFTIKRVLNKHKEIDSPYNTYKYTGLPPGPIRVPSPRSVNAVLDHQDHNYIFMCAREDFSGYHNFATNLRAHNNNAQRYHRALSAAGIYN